MKRNTPARMRRAAALAAFAALLAPGALLADYAKEFNVKFSGYAGSTTLTNFPVLVRLSQARNAFDYSQCQVAGGGDTRFLLLADSSCVWLLSLPLGALAAFVWNLPPFWVYFFLRLEYPLKGIVCFIRYCTGKWVREIRASN